MHPASGEYSLWMSLHVSVVQFCDRNVQVDFKRFYLTNNIHLIVCLKCPNFCRYSAFEHFIQTSIFQTYLRISLTSSSDIHRMQLSTSRLEPDIMCSIPCWKRKWHIPVKGCLHSLIPAPPHVCVCVCLCVYVCVCVPHMAPLQCVRSWGSTLFTPVSILVKSIPHWE